MPNLSRYVFHIEKPDNSQRKFRFYLDYIALKLVDLVIFSNPCSYFVKFNFGFKSDLVHFFEEETILKLPTEIAPLLMWKNLSLQFLSKKLNRFRVLKSELLCV